MEAVIDMLDFSHNASQVAQYHFIGKGSSLILELLDGDESLTLRRIHSFALPSD